MKKALKDWLHRIGLLNALQPLYFNLLAADATTLPREIRYRSGASPDGFPFPPPSLTFDVIACRWAPVFFDSGKRIVDDMEALLQRQGYTLAAFERVLDFGCGCGRLIRHVHGRTAAALHGSDYNPALVAWCQEHLPFGTFHTNHLAPPLAFADETFDFAYARSVFTHLPGELQRQWIGELRRILRPDGILYLTMHGRPLAGGLTGGQRAALEAGQLVVTYSTLAGDNLCSTYAYRSFVEAHLLDGFTLAGFVEGRNREHLRQDIYLLRKER